MLGGLVHFFRPQCADFYVQNLGYCHDLYREINAVVLRKMGCRNDGAHEVRLECLHKQAGTTICEPSTFCLFASLH